MSTVYSNRTPRYTEVGPGKDGCTDPDGTDEFEDADDVEE